MARLGRAKPKNPQLLPLPVLTSGPTQISGSDSATVTDAISPPIVVSTPNDTATITDSPTTIALSTQVDSATATDAPQKIGLSPSETATASDAISSPIVVGTPNDSASITDAPQVGLSQSDSATGTDSPTVINVSASETATLTDTPTLIEPLGNAETATNADASAGIVQFVAITGSDSAKVYDTTDSIVAATLVPVAGTPVGGHDGRRYYQYISEAAYEREVKQLVEALLREGMAMDEAVAVAIAITEEELVA